MVEVYGAIKNTNTGEEFVWPDMQSPATILEQLQSVNPLYGFGWTFAGDQGFEDSNIHISNGAKSQTFYGRNAVREAINYLKPLV